MRARRTVGAAILIMGLFLAVCTRDGSSHELAARFTGVAMTAAGAGIGGYFQKKTQRDNHLNSQHHVQ